MSYDEASKAAKVPQIQIDLESLAKSVARLREEMSGLDARLSPVVIPGAPSINMSRPMEPAGSICSDVSNKLHSAIDEINSTSDMIQSIKLRLEI